MNQRYVMTKLLTQRALAGLAAVAIAVTACAESPDTVTAEAPAPAGAHARRALLRAENFVNSIVLCSSPGMATVEMLSEVDEASTQQAEMSSNCIEDVLALTEATDVYKEIALIVTDAYSDAEQTSAGTQARRRWSECMNDEFGEDFQTEIDFNEWVYARQEQMLEELGDSEASDQAATRTALDFDDDAYARALECSNHLVALEAMAWTEADRTFRSRFGANALVTHEILSLDVYRSAEWRTFENAAIRG